MTNTDLDKRVEELFRRVRNEQERENHRAAIELIDKALALNPSDTMFWSARGQSLYDLKDYTRAEADTRIAIEKDRRNYHAWALLGQIKAHTGNYEKAAEYYKKSLRLSEDHSTYTLLAAVEYEFDLLSAIEHARKALEIDPNWDEAKKVLDAAQDEMKKRDK